MDLLTGDRLGLFALFILPGVISLKVYALLVPSERATTSEHLVDALAYGLLNLGIWAVPIFWVVLPRQSSAPVLFWVAMSRSWSLVRLYLDGSRTGCEAPAACAAASVIPLQPHGTTTLVEGSRAGCCVV